LLLVREVREKSGESKIQGNEKVREIGKIPELGDFRIFSFVLVNVNQQNNIAFSISSFKGYSVMFQTRVTMELPQIKQSSFNFQPEPYWSHYFRISFYYVRLGMGQSIP